MKKSNVEVEFNKVVKEVIGPVMETRMASGSVTESSVLSAKVTLAVREWVPGPKVCVVVVPVSPRPTHSTVAPVRS